MPVPRVPIPRPAVLRQSFMTTRSAPATLYSYSTSTTLLGGWSGTSPKDHAVNRTEEKDTESKPAHQGMREKEQGDSMSTSISQKGGEANRKSEKDEPAAPKPVIGMNDQIGGKGR